MSEFDETMTQEEPLNGEISTSNDFIPICAPCDPLAPPVEQLADLPPLERVVLPADVVDIGVNDEVVFVVGTRGEKVTKLKGLTNEKYPNLKV